MPKQTLSTQFPYHSVSPKLLAWTALSILGLTALSAEAQETTASALASSNEAVATDRSLMAAIPSGQSIQRNFVEGWREGKIEASFLLNQNLHHYELDASVAGGTVTLTGTVQKTVEKALADQIAKGVEGVTEVINLIAVDPDYHYFKAHRHNEPTQASRFEDATITAAIKAKYVLHPNLASVDIKIETDQGQVLLYGNVPSNAERDLAEQVALNVPGVVNVDNRLRLGIVNGVALQ